MVLSTSFQSTPAIAGERTGIIRPDPLVADAFSVRV